MQAKPKLPRKGERRSGPYPGKYKLTREQVAALIAEAIPANGANYEALAARYGVHPVTVYGILTGRSWLSVPRPGNWRMPPGLTPGAR